MSLPLRVEGGQILLDETQDRLKESLAWVGVLCRQERRDETMLAVDGHRDRPVVSIEIAHQDAAGHDLVIEDQLTVVARVNARASLL